MSDVIAIDFESFYSSKLKYTIKTMIAEQYCRHHLFDAYLISACDSENAWAGSPSSFNWASIEGKIIVSHNKFFDYNVWLELARRGICPPPNFKEFHCTANLTSYLCNRRALDAAVEHLYGVHISKGARSDANGKRWPQDFSEEERAEMLTYARGDVYWCRKLWVDHSHKWPAHERRLSEQTIKQGMEGVQIDRALLDRYITQTHEMKLSAENQIPWIKDAEDEEWDEFNARPTSTKCIAEMARREKIPACPVKSDDEEAYEIWESTYGPNHTWIYAVSAWRSINRLYKTFLTVKERLRDDDTLPFALKYMGAHTGRWAGDARVNFQNMRKKPVLCNEHGLLETNEKRIDLAMDEKEETGRWPAWVRYAIDFRNLVIPRPGKKMIVCDLAQIEPRVLAWLVGNHKLLELIRGGMSIYEAFARANMGWTGGNLKKESPGIYSLAKAQLLALGFQAGWEKFILMAWNLARVDITKDDPEEVEETDRFTGETKKASGYGFNSKRVVAEFRAQNPLTTGLWKNLDDGFKRSLGGDFVMTLPSGRRMIYNAVRADTRIEQDKKTGKPTRRTVFTADSDGRRKQFYGGKLTENIVQATARDVFAHHLLRLEEEGFRVLFSVHDEAIVECDPSRTAQEVEQIMSECPEWLAACPIAAEATEVERYCK